MTRYQIIRLLETYPWLLVVFIGIALYLAAEFLDSDAKNWAMVFKNTMATLLTFAAVIVVVGFLTWLAVK